MEVMARMAMRERIWKVVPSDMVVDASADVLYESDANNCFWIVGLKSKERCSDRKGRGKQ